MAQLSDRIERAVAKGILATEGAAIGGAIGGPVGATVGAGIGLVYGDREMVFMEPMIAIPARQEYMLSGQPDVKVYIRAGETLEPTGGAVEAVQEELSEAAPKRAKRRKKNPWIQFNKKFSYRSKRKSETSQEYLRKRTKAARLAYNNTKRGGK